MADQQYCLKWNNFSQHLKYAFSSIWSSDSSFTDVTLAVQGGFKVRAHKMVVAACSNYFKMLLVNDTSEYPVLILHDVTRQELEALVHFMYHGEVNVTQEVIPGLLKAAETLQVRGLCASPGAALKPTGGTTVPAAVRPPKRAAEPTTAPPPAKKGRRRAGAAQVVVPLPAAAAPESQAGTQAGPRDRSVESEDSRETNGGPPRLDHNASGDSDNEGELRIDEQSNGMEPETMIDEQERDGDGDGCSQDSSNEEQLYPLPRSGPDAASPQAYSATSRLKTLAVTIKLEPIPPNDLEAAIVASMPKTTTVRGADLSEAPEDQQKLSFHEPRPCPHCRRVYRDAATLRTHLSIMHTEAEPKAVLGLPFLPSWRHTAGSQPPFLPSWGHTGASQPPFLLSWKHTIASQPPFLPAWRRTSGSQPSFLPSWGHTAGSKPPILPSWSHTAGSKPPILPSWRRTSGSQPPFLPSWKHTSGSQPPILPSQTRVLGASPGMPGISGVPLVVPGSVEAPSGLHGSCTVPWSALRPLRRYVPLVVPRPRVGRRCQCQPMPPGRLGGAGGDTVTLPAVSGDSAARLCRCSESGIGVRSGSEHVPSAVTTGASTSSISVLPPADVSSMWGATGGATAGGTSGVSSMWGATGGATAGGTSGVSSMWRATGGATAGGTSGVSSMWGATGGPPRLATADVTMGVADGGVSDTRRDAAVCVGVVSSAPVAVGAAPLMPGSPKPAPYTPPFQSRPSVREGWRPVGHASPTAVPRLNRSATVSLLTDTGPTAHLPTNAALTTAGGWSPRVTSTVSAAIVTSPTGMCRLVRIGPAPAGLAPSLRMPPTPLHVRRPGGGRGIRTPPGRRTQPACTQKPVLLQRRVCRVYTLSRAVTQTVRSPAASAGQLAAGAAGHSCCSTGEPSMLSGAGAAADPSQPGGEAGISQGPSAAPVPDPDETGGEAGISQGPLVAPLPDADAALSSCPDPDPTSLTTSSVT